jgi:hypothetical protein
VLAEDKKNCDSPDAIQSGKVKAVAHEPTLARRVPAAVTGHLGPPDQACTPLAGCE